MSYVFDTSALIGAWVRLYPMDAFPLLWDRMSTLADGGRLMVPDEVFEELKAQDDALCEWVKERKDAVVQPTTRALLLEARAVLADHPHLTKTGTGRGHADPFVIAAAALQGCPVVTQEQGGSVAKPRIPFVCGERSVPCMTFLEVIRAEGWRF